MCTRLDEKKADAKERQMKFVRGGTANKSALSTLSYVMTELCAFNAKDVR